MFQISAQSFGEGTRELWPTNATNNESGCIWLTNTNTYLTAWAKHTNTDDNQRIKFTISANWATEIVFIGMYCPGGLTNFYIRYPDGTSTLAQPYPTVGQAGHIDTWNQAIAGPNTINATGYLPFIFHPTMPGDYSIDFDISAAGDAKIELFDLTVASDNFGTYSKLPGRLWAKVWQLSAQKYANYDYFNGIFYVYSDDHIVTKFNANGLRVGGCDIYCNEWGTSTIGIWENRRKSVSNQSSVVPQYKLFLNEPDPALFAEGVLGKITSATQTNQFCDGSVVFTVVVDKPGKITMNIDLLPLGSGLEDVTLNADVVTGSNDITWNGNNGLGAPVSSGATINMQIDYLNCLTNLPLWDIESSEKGFKVDLVKPLPSPIPPGFTTKLKLYWDDTNLSTGILNLTGCTYPSSVTITGCHDWPFVNNGNGGLGNNHTVNTWWYFLSQNSQSIAVNIIRTPGTPAGVPTGSTPVCEGQTNVTYTAPAINSAESYVWTLPDGSTVTTATNQIV